MKGKSILNFVVALPCEANPIITHYKLKKLSTPLPVFANNDQTIYLIIAGVGKIKMAVATTYLATITGNKSFNSFLNVGIAGSSQYPLGQALIANKITEHSTMRNWYPFITPFKKILQTALITHDTPQKEYPSIGMVDMEGAAFFQAASIFVTQEHIQILKVISDNSISDQEEISSETVRYLILDNLSSILNAADYLRELSIVEQSLEFDLEALNIFQEKWHFTHSQKNQLKEFLRRWCICLAHQDPFIFCQDEKNATDVIKKIIFKLEEDTI